MYSEYYCAHRDEPWGDPAYVGIRNWCVGKDRKGRCNTIGHPERINCPWIKVRVVTPPKPVVKYTEECTAKFEISKKSRKPRSRKRRKT